MKRKITTILCVVLAIFTLYIPLKLQSLSTEYRMVPMDAIVIIWASCIIVAAALLVIAFKPQVDNRKND